MGHSAHTHPTNPHPDRALFKELAHRHRQIDSFKLAARGLTARVGVDVALTVWELVLKDMGPLRHVPVHRGWYRSALVGSALEWG